MHTYPLYMNRYCWLSKKTQHGKYFLYGTNSTPHVCCTFIQTIQLDNILLCLVFNMCNEWSTSATTQYRGVVDLADNTLLCLVCNMCNEWSVNATAQDEVLWNSQRAHLLFILRL